jgi:peptide deformylase
MYKVIEKRKTDKLLPPLSITEDILEIARHFLDSAMAIGNAVGLAAPQVGLELRMCAVKAPHWFVVINPKITQTLGKPFKTEEGCLTWPDSDVIANRYSNVEVEYYSVETGRVEKQWYSGIEGLIWQHELDHLDGVEEKLVPKLGISQQREMFKPNIGRNEPCPCESGKKYKKCCHKLIKFRLA